MDSVCYTFGIVFGVLVLGRLHAAKLRSKAAWIRGVHALDKLPRSLAQFLKRGYEGGFMIVTLRPSKKCIWFQKYIRSKGDYGIEFVLPEANWSYLYFPILKDYCIEQSMEFRVVKVGEKGPELTGSLHVDFGKDIQRAYHFSVHVITHILGIPDYAKYAPTFAGFSWKDVLVDNIRET